MASNLSAAIAQFHDVDSGLSSAQFEASGRKWHKKVAAIQAKRLLNDQAYFVFMFSRIEAHITEQAKKLIVKKRAAKRTWASRLPWENFEADELAFKKRLELLTERGGAMYSLVIKYYMHRNSIAHGGAFISPILMPVVIVDLQMLESRLRA